MDMDMIGIWIGYEYRNGKKWHYHPSIVGYDAEADSYHEIKSK